jgi:hypothetical protein
MIRLEAQKLLVLPRFGAAAYWQQYLKLEIDGSQG